MMNTVTEFKTDQDEMDYAEYSSHNSKQKGKERIRLICISDTHNMHEGLTKELNDLYRSENDILLHAGDVCEGGTLSELKCVDKWFGKLPYKHKYVISGNMDGMGLEEEHVDGHHIFQNAIYLEHELCEIRLANKHKSKISLFGSPYTPKFFGGFQIDDDKHGQQLWSQVPANVDILMVHGPPKGILGRTSSGYSVGDRVLRKEILNRIKPKVVVFGHVHPSNDVIKDEQNGIVFANVAMHDKLAGLKKAKHHRCTVIEIEE